MVYFGQGLIYKVRGIRILRSPHTPVHGEAWLLNTLREGSSKRSSSARRIFGRLWRLGLVAALCG